MRCSLHARGAVRLASLAGAVLAAGVVSCSRAPDPASGAGAGKAPELVLYCGAGVRPAAAALIGAFEERHSIRVSATYAGSGKLLGQLASSRRGDLFMPGSGFYVDKAVEQDLAIADTKRIAAYFVPVIFVRKGNPLGVATLADFAKMKMRVGLGDERAVAIGRRSKQLFEKSGVAYDEVLRNVVCRSGTVNELGVAIQMKTVDATIVWDANARQFEDAGDIVEIPPEENIVSTIPIAVLSFSRHPDEAKRFVEFVTSEEGRRILREHRYTVDPPKTQEE
ncbi:MAG: molybdate ABC transporter substrate-binding protein [Planctomycetota bacterium]